MPRIGKLAPRPVETLTRYLTEGVTDAIKDVCESLNKFDPLPFGRIPDFLSDEGLSLMDQLDVSVNDRCSEEVLLAHPVGGPLAQTMGRISLANMDLRHGSTRTNFSLKNETGDSVCLKPHRDLLDGHSVIFNYAVFGNLYYLLDGERHGINSNELVILNGAALWGDITNFLPGQKNNKPYDGWRTLGGVTMVHAVESEGFTSRNRLLAYAEGRETLVTQIPPELPTWF